MAHHHAHRDEAAQHIGAEVVRWVVGPQGQAGLVLAAIPQPVGGLSLGFGRNGGAVCLVQEQEGQPRPVPEADPTRGGDRQRVDRPAQDLLQRQLLVQVPDREFVLAGQGELVGAHHQGRRSELGRRQAGVEDRPGQVEIGEGLDAAPELGRLRIGVCAQVPHHIRHGPQGVALPVGGVQHLRQQHPLDGSHRDPKQRRHEALGHRHRRRRCRRQRPERVKARGGVRADRDRLLALHDSEGLLPLPRWGPVDRHALAAASQDGQRR